MLKHHADARFDGRLAVGNFGFGTVDKYFAAIGFIKAVKDRHQCRFSGPVFANNAVYRARLNRDRDVLIGLYWSKRF